MENHFSAEYSRLIGSIDNMVGQLNDTKDATDNLQVPDRGLFYDDIAKGYEARAAALKEIQEIVVSTLKALSKYLS